MQTRLESGIETVTNTIIGYSIALVSQILIFPLYGIRVSLETNLWIGLWFTAVSLLRGYALRRWFNKRLKAKIHQIATSIEGATKS